MILYIPVGSGPLREKYVALGCGMIVCRPDFRFPKLDCPWIFDNGAFVDFVRRRDFDDKAFDRCVERLMDVQPCRRPAWCVTPDIVASPKSLAFSVNYRESLPDDLNWYLAIQDGMTPDLVDIALARVPFAGLFIGGSTEWKNSMACEWVRYGHARKMPVHIGRVNRWNRLKWAVQIGADSIDGTGWTRDSRWVEYVRHMPKPEPLLFGEVS